jgi:hypothetical protein
MAVDDPTIPPAPPPPSDPPNPPSDPPNPPSDPPKPDDDDKLGEPGKAALQRERDARKQAEKDAKEAKARADALEREKLSDQEKLAQDAANDRAKAEAGTTKLRRANLLVALADEGIVGAKAKAAVRLLDEVQFDDSDEPTNLQDRITAAKAEFGDEMFKGATPSGAPNGFPPPNHHQGPRAPADDEDAQFDGYMRQNFPHLYQPPTVPT